jgi:predicted DNA-binding transcriptional regulator YafY
MKIARLLEITTLLLGRGTLTARELAEHFGVSTRTIYRDVEALSTAGVPIYMSKGNGGGISLLENYTLNKLLLSEQESNSIFLALKTLQSTQYPEIDKILNKMEAMFKNAQDNDWIDVDYFHWGSSPNERDKFNTIKHAIVNKQVITFEYVNANGERGSRAVEPLKLFFKGSSWYLVAYCRKRNSQRLFRLSRIKNVDLTIENFTPKLLQEWHKEKVPPAILLKLRFCDKVLNRLYDDFDENQIVKLENGMLEVNIAIPENEWLYGYLLSYGHYVEVLEPQHVRNILINKIQETLKKYGSPSQI